MPTIEGSTFQTIACIVLSVLCAYAGGRVHQWYRHGMDRDRSFREGFSHGYHALFPLAARGPRRAAGRRNPPGSLFTDPRRGGDDGAGTGLH